MHIMEGDCDKSGGLLTGERAPDLLESDGHKTIVDGHKATECIADSLKTIADGLKNIADDVSQETAEELTSGDVPERRPTPPLTPAPALTNGDHAESIPEEDSEDVVKGTSDSEDGFKPEDDVEKEEEEEDEDEDVDVKEDVEDADTKDTNDNDKSRLPEVDEASPEAADVGKEEPEADSPPPERTCSKPPSPARTSPEDGSRPASLSGSRPASPSSPKRSVPGGSKEAERRPTIWVKPPGAAPVAASGSKPSSPLHPVKDELLPANDLDLRNNVSTISITTQNENVLRKRSADKEGEGEISSGSESDSGRKKVKVERDGESVSPYPPPENQVGSMGYMDYERERLIQDFVSDCSQRPEEMNRAGEKLQKEVETLNELLKAKEMEWNTILRLKKLKEETLERLLRRKRQAAIEESAHDRFLDQRFHESTLKNALKNHHGANQLMMVPIVSSSPTTMLNRAPPPIRMPDYSKMQQRPILPKPYHGVVDHSTVMREGRNGPVLDVKSIIADYSVPSRSRHPQDIPRRGRRVRGDPGPRTPPVNPSSLISMSNMALGSGARVRTVNDSPYLHPNAEQARQQSSSEGRGDASAAAGYKDVLAQFAKLTGQPPPLGPAAPKAGSGSAPPPPYPEVTLHPVGGRPLSPPTSLLHGILTKSAPSSRPSNFSPTLARLLTAPDRPPHPIPPPPYRPQTSSRVSTISDIINSSKKSRNEITITPVPGNQPQKLPKEEVIMADEDDAESGDRLVIDESADESPLQCQGCKQKSAQFVCAGCGNQWYCSRECQVTAWEEHSDVCSG
uniref:MYND-type domain-containing protein n=4 Tax=Lygus hesperus TaxID=30085 RepID=A0A0A9YMV2_LYGHE